MTRKRRREKYDKWKMMYGFFGVSARNSSYRGRAVRVNNKGALAITVSYMEK